MGDGCPFGLLRLSSDPLSWLRRGPTYSFIKIKKARRHAPQRAEGGGPEVHASLGLAAAQQRHPGAVDLDGPGVLEGVLPAIFLLRSPWKLPGEVSFFNQGVLPDIFLQK